MLIYLRGKILDKARNYLIVETNNLGYQVFVSENLWRDSQAGRDTELYLHHQVREEADDLYGFKNLEDLELFQLLLSISGVGPKSALGVLGIASTAAVKTSIVRGDAELLTRVSGIGRKTADRVVLELKNKLGKLTVTAGIDSLEDWNNDEIDALVALGYSLSEAREALQALPTELTDKSVRIRAALKSLSKSR
jgi:Holliday junction DNA helicase RuvA